MDNQERWAILRAVSTARKYIPREPSVIADIIQRLLVVLASNDPVARSVALAWVFLSALGGPHLIKFPLQTTGAVCEACGR